MLRTTSAWHGAQPQAVKTQWRAWRTLVPMSPWISSANVALPSASPARKRLIDRYAVLLSAFTAWEWPLSLWLSKEVGLLTVVMMSVGTCTLQHSKFSIFQQGYCRHLQMFRSGSLLTSGPEGCQSCCGVLTQDGWAFADGLKQKVPMHGVWADDIYCLSYCSGRTEIGVM